MEREFLGRMNEGMSGNFDILIVKSFLDFFTAMIFATSLGISVASIVVPQTLVQVILAYSAVFIIPFVTPEMRGDFCCGRRYANDSGRFSHL